MPACWLMMILLFIFQDMENRLKRVFEILLHLIVVVAFALAVLFIGVAFAWPTVIPFVICLVGGFVYGQTILAPRMVS